MIRQSVLCIFVIFLCIYAWKDWFVSLCGLILMTAIMGHQDFPLSFADIQGLNVWNIVFADVFLAWVVNRRRQGLLWDMPTIINVFLVLWLCVILAGWMWMVVDRSQLANHLLKDLISDELVNTIKWPLLGLMLFDACRTRHRIKVAFACIILFFALFTVQIARAVPGRAVLEPGNMRPRKNLFERVGISPNGAGKMMSGVPWAMLTIIPLLKTRKCRFWRLGILCLLGACVASLFALALTGSRAGYIGCGTTILFLCFVRWRRFLLLLPLAVLILPIVLPGATSRMLLGFGETNVAGETITNEYDVTSGRSVIWPAVISKIPESPVFGFGREAMVRTGLQQHLLNIWGERQGVAVKHPHNAYLEVLLDSGLIGFVIIIGLYTLIWVYSVRLFVDRGDPLYTAAGGFALALLTGHLVANMGGQSFYAEELHVGLWCAIGVMFRLYVARDRLIAEVNRALVASTLGTKDITISQRPFVELIHD